jgi:moderate conductance mechanosensitive channel
MRSLLLAWFLALALAVPALAQSPPPQITPDQARQALDVLNDPAKRAEFTATLEAIVKGAPPAATPSSGALPIPLAPNSLGADVLLGASQFLGDLAARAIAAAHAVQTLPVLWAWLQVMATDPAARGILLATAWRLALVLALGLAAEWAVRRMVRGPIMRLVRHAPTNGVPDESGEERAEVGETEPVRRGIAARTLLRRVPLVLGRLVLELLPIFAFLLVGHAIVVSAIGGEDVTRFILLAVIGAYAISAAIVCIARMMLSPRQPRLRLLYVSDDFAVYAMRWVRRITVFTLAGYAAAEVGLLLGLSDAAHTAVLKAVGLVDHLLLAIIVLQQRRTVRHLIRAPQGAEGSFAALRNGLARIWHWLALAFLAASWVVSAIEARNGYGLMLRYFLATFVVLIIARLAQIILVGGLDRMLRLKPATALRYPGIEARFAIYHPVLRSVTRAAIFVLGLLLLLQLWGIGSFNWLLRTDLGEHVVSSLVTLGITCLGALVVWEAVNASVERHLVRLAADAQIARSARLRTLLPLLRSTLLVTILIVLGLIVLSEIGVNIGPLLAGAGIVGVAIGFGSQKLVQDLITGVFLLLENAMQVGDAVTVAGLSGNVEALSIRTIRLRASDGSVHIIPFSSVTSVTNVNRGIGNASVNVTVDYREDTDRVCETLKEIVQQMREDADCAPKMLSDLQLWGVDKVDGASATIVGQVVCTDSGRWSVQRELNRRMKQRFEELGITLFNPMRTVAFLPQRHEPDQA